MSQEAVGILDPSPAGISDQDRRWALLRWLSVKLGDAPHGATLEAAERFEEFLAERAAGRKRSREVPSKVGHSKIGQAKIDQPKVDQPKIDQPKVAHPKIDQPKIDQPKLEMTKTPARRIVFSAADAELAFEELGAAMLRKPNRISRNPSRWLKP